jgi:hypothetical protein
MLSQQALAIPAALWVAASWARCPAAALVHGRSSTQAGVAISWRWTIGMSQTGRRLCQRVERPVGSIADAAFGGRGILIISLKIFVVVDSIEEYFYRFGVAPHLDKSGIFDFVKVIVIGD